MKHKPSPELSFVFDDLPDSGFIRLNQLISLAVTPFSASTVWRRVKEGTFPQPVRISPQVTAWRVREIRDWLECPGSYVSDCRSNAKVRDHKPIGGAS